MIGALVNGTFDEGVLGGDDDSDDVESITSGLVGHKLTTLLVVEGIVGAIDTLGEFVDNRRKQIFFEAVVKRLDDLMSDTDASVDESERLFDNSVQHTVNRYWARANGELGELTRMAGDFSGSVEWFRKSLRVWDGFSPQSQIDLIVVLSYVAAIIRDKDVCLNALALCDLLQRDPTHPDLLSAAKLLARVHFGEMKASEDSAHLLELLRL